MTATAARSPSTILWLVLTWIWTAWATIWDWMQCWHLEMLTRCSVP